MDFGCCGGVGSSGGEHYDHDSQGSEGLKRKCIDLESSVKAVKDALVKENAVKDAFVKENAGKDALVKENAEKSTKIRRLMQDNVKLEQTVLRLENFSFQEPMTSMPRQNPFVVFSAEVWEMIIKSMNRSSDLLMLCLAFPSLEPLVKKIKRTTLLFENVLPLVCKHLDWRDIINCRLACGKWNEDVCALLANWNAPNLLPLTSKTPVPDYEPPWSLKNAYSFNNHNQSEIQKFLMKMADLPGNPLFGRFLSLSATFGTKLELEHFWKSVLELVQKFGEQVWSFEITAVRQSSIAFYKALQKTLIYLPNIRYLNADVYLRDSRLKGLSTSNLTDDFGSSPLPPLPFLQSLKLCFDRETKMIGAFSPFFSKQIHRLELLEETLSNVNLKDESLRGLISLEYLKVELTSGEDILRLLKFPSSKLRKLHLYTENYHTRKTPSITSGQIVNLLEKFPRLEHLGLSFYRVESSSSLSSRMRFSRLETLEMAIDTDENDLYHNLDFLLWFPSLKHLVIIDEIDSAEKCLLNVNEADMNSTLKIRKYLYNYKMLDSNVWTLIPSLESLNILGQRVYTRKMLENRIS